MYGIRMTPKVVVVPSFKAIGMEAKFISILSPNKTNDIVIPKLWDQYSKRSAEIRNRASSADFGLIYCLDDPESPPYQCLYMCAAKVSDASVVPPGMVAREVPEGKYAVFTHKGTLDKLGHAMKYIHGSWIPNSGYDLDNRPELEVYDERFQLNSEDSELDIYIPIR
jgi:AraC family transcriptional regulator